MIVVFPGIEITARIGLVHTDSYGIEPNGCDRLNVVFYFNRIVVE